MSCKAEEMRGFVALLATVAMCSAGLRSPVAAGEEMDKNASVEVSSLLAATESSSVPLTKSSSSRQESLEDRDRRTGLSGCPDRCRCEVDGLLHRVDCSDLGLQEIPVNMSVFMSYL